MELNGYISIIISGKTETGNLNPKDIDISETKELLSDVEVLLFPLKSERQDRPVVSYEVLEGSVKNIFHIPVARVIMFTALISEVGKKGLVELLDTKAAQVIEKWQRKAYTTDRKYIIASSASSGEPVITINKETQFVAAQSNWVHTSVYLYGKIYEEGGLNKVNLHIITERHGKLLVKATKEQLVSGENKLYKTYGLWVKGKQNIATGEYKDLELIDFLLHQLKYDEVALKLQIARASERWRSVKNKDLWLAEIRGGEHEVGH